MTVRRLRDELSNAEFIQWQVFFGWRAQLEELEMKAAADGR